MLGFDLQSWELPGIIGGIGFFYIIINIGCIISSIKENRHISGIPLLGGIHLLIAGLISPIKWLALLFVLDYSFWSFLYSFFIGGRFDKQEDDTEE